MGLEEILVERLAQAVSERVLKALAASKTPTVQPVLLTVKEAATYLGRSERAVEHLIADRTISVVRHGRRVHLHVDDLNLWIAKNKY